MATVAPVGPQIAEISPHDVEKNVHVARDNQTSEFPDDIKEETDDGSGFKQDGVKQVEAITQVWSKQMLIATFIFLYLVAFVDSLLQSVQSNLTAYVTSSFSQHGLLATTSIVSSVLGGVSKLTIAKVIDIWGRVWGFLSMVGLMVLGMILKATCKNVETYAAAQTLYWVGHLGLLYVIDVYTADLTSLRNRMIIMGINTTPLLATNFAGPKIAELFYTNVNFRWAFGAFCIILVAFCIPVAVIFIMSDLKAKKLGLAPEKAESRSIGDSIKFYFVQFDVIGLCLVTFGWSLLLLPFSLVTTAPKGWETGYIIAMIVLGVFLLGAFAIWEKWYSPVPFLPFHFLADRTILGASLLYGIMFISIFCWDTYYYSYLQVVHNQSITHSGYILNSFSLMSSFISPFIGVGLRYLGRFKWPAFAGIPFCVLGTALLIYFRHPGADVGYLVMCQLFNGISSGIWAMTAQLAVMSAVNHQEVAVALALWSMFGSIGSAIGIAISGALWTNVFPTQLYNRLPESAKDQAAAIYGDITIQMSYPFGSPERDAINLAYGDVQRKMVIAGAAFIPLIVGCLFMWRNIDVRKKDAKSTQARGNVF